MISWVMVVQHMVYGLSGSGKSTVAGAEGVLHDMGVLCYRLDGDNVRFGINKNLGL